MSGVRLQGRKVRYCEYNDRDRVLSIEMADQTVWDFQEVSSEVYVRLRNAPNPDTYFEDRISDEYLRKPGQRRRPPPEREIDPIAALFQKDDSA